MAMVNILRINLYLIIFSEREEDNTDLCSDFCVVYIYVYVVIGNKNPPPARFPSLSRSRNTGRRIAFDRTEVRIGQAAVCIGQVVL